MTKTRAHLIWLRWNGVCYLCGQSVAWGSGLEIEHPIGIFNGGSDADAHLRPVHAACHKPKTAHDARVAAKIRRIRAREEGRRRRRKKIQSRGLPKGARRLPTKPFRK